MAVVSSTRALLTLLWIMQSLLLAMGAISTQTRSSGTSRTLGAIAGVRVASSACSATMEMCTVALMTSQRMAPVVTEVHPLSGFAECVVFFTIQWCLTCSWGACSTVCGISTLSVSLLTLQHMQYAFQVSSC